jgi:hypothetical protein
MSEHRCETCRFWDTKRSRDALVEVRDCRRFPPTVLPGPNHGTVVPYRPRLWPTDWCGEYQPTERTP